MRMPARWPATARGVVEDLRLVQKEEAEHGTSFFKARLLAKEEGEEEEGEEEEGEAEEEEAAEEVEAEEGDDDLQERDS